MSLGLGFGLGTLGFRFLQFLIPEARVKLVEEILINSAEDMANSNAIPIEVAGNKLILLNTETGLVAFSRICTDLGCLVSWDKAKEQFICPCHQGVYDKNGKNIAGPPPRPLDRFGVVKKGGNIYIKVMV
ncbi:MAG: ubiquinol-cytochrome c reductase iron-sulfur subunit [Deltaproteobacteria bacterium]|nr:ubiquinol-cytochrome c reductase iron-sulfur subunit [Deltaproteobacteria bacterium]